MPLNEKDYLLLDKHFRQELTAEEEQELQERLHDEEVRRELEWREELQPVFQASGREALKKQVQRWEQPATGRGSSLLQLALITLIVVLLILGIWWFFFRTPPPSSQELFAEYFMAYPNVVAPIEKSMEERDNETLAFEAYELGAYPQAETQFAQLEQTEVIRFYRGVTALAQEQAAQAISMLEPIAADKTARFQQAAEWYMALSYLLQREYDKAGNWLKKIRATDGHTFQKRAERLYEELER